MIQGAALHFFSKNHCEAKGKWLGTVLGLMQAALLLTPCNTNGKSLNRAVHKAAAAAAAAAATRLPLPVVAAAAVPSAVGLAPAEPADFASPALPVPAPAAAAAAAAAVDLATADLADCAAPVLPVAAAAAVPAAAAAAGTAAPGLPVPPAAALAAWLRAHSRFGWPSGPHGRAWPVSVDSKHQGMPHHRLRACHITDWSQYISQTEGMPHHRLKA
eukprot:1156237-Pelagomonas_calceolata.AAC.4